MWNSDRIMFFFISIFGHLFSSFLGGRRAIFAYTFRMLLAYFESIQKAEDINLSFKGVEGWEWLQKMRYSRYSHYGFV